MNRILDNDVDANGHGYAGRRRPEYDDSEPADREISLGTPTILGIFFALALVCAAFFGFGYSLGRRSVPPAAIAVAPSPVIASASKPTAGSLAALPKAAAEPAQTAVVPLDTAPAAPPARAKNAASPADGLIAGDKIPATQPAPAAPQPAAASLLPGTSFMVQVAAVSSQDIADIEVAALKKQGFDVVVRHEPQDKLLHIQMGPFTDKKAAEAMRARVIADGFNAIVK